MDQQTAYGKRKTGEKAKHLLQNDIFVDELGKWNNKSYFHHTVVQYQGETMENMVLPRDHRDIGSHRFDHNLVTGSDHIAAATGNKQI